MPSRSLPLSVLQQIDQVCDSFEAAWHAGVRPRIEDYLDASTIQERTELFRELLAREVELRKKAGESPDLAEYLGRFGFYGDLIGTVINNHGPGGDTLLLPITGTQVDSGAEPGESHAATIPDATAMRERTWDPDVAGRSAKVVVPERIGRFRPSRLLGKGNFLVFLAHDEENGRDVAIKIARPEDPFASKRLMSLAEEAQRLSTLEHPGIVKIYEFVAPIATSDLGDADDGGFIVLEFIDGPTLEQFFRAGRPTPEHLAELMAKVADAVHHAHIAGLVHRDLKPSNILLDSKGDPRVCDFGLAVDEEIQRMRRGEVAGTLQYMAPEQVRGESNRLDGRTDLWALGVILYRGLTGRLPFRGRRTADCFDEILHREPRPPRQCDDGIPRELERICLRCLSRPMSERYLTAKDLADDLRLWLSRASAEPACTAQVPPVVPKGLRAFGPEDAAFFLSLLPGPRGSDGTPDSILFWKTRIEALGGDGAFGVGLIYGPSGGGKSSFVKAGLLPQLDRERVRVIQVQASPAGTEARLLAELRRQLPPLPREGDLADAIAMLRDDPHIRPREKLLLVFDQFEQWLQARPMEPDAELVRALRQCDGRRVAALLLVRDDFWMATTRLLRAVEAPLVEGTNSAAVELFDARHTRQVLQKFGQALGQIPSAPDAGPGKAAAFLDEAVRGLVSDDGRIAPVRLSLFVEVVRRRAWTTATLDELGGVEGIGFKFLEESFDVVGALPSRRLHRKAAESVLRLLLPAPSSMIRGTPRPVQALREASGYADRPDDFADLMQLLDHDLRLISATDPQELTSAEREPGQDHQFGPGELSYQLAHDYLIRPIRQWLERNERSTPAGRARLRLGAVTATWMARPGSHQLPSPLEYLGILWHTRPGEWSGDQRRLMRAAGRHLVGRITLTVAVLGAIGLVGKTMLDKEQARSALNLALAAKDRDLPAILLKVEPHHDLVMNELEARASDEGTTDHDREVASVLLYRFSPTPQRGRHLRKLLLSAPGPDRVELIRSALEAQPEYAEVDELRGVLSEQSDNPGLCLRAACALARLGSGVLQESPQVDALLVQALVAEDRRDVPRWLELLGPFVSRLLAPLADYCRDRQSDPELRPIAAEALAVALKRQGDSEALARALVESLPDASQLLLHELAATGNPDSAIAYLDKLLEEKAGGDSQSSVRMEESSVSRRVHAAMALMVLDKPEVLWSMLRHQADPRVRTLLIQRLAGSSLLRHRVHQRLSARGIDAVQRQALLLIWAETPRGGLSAAVATDVVNEARRLYLDDPDSGVHSAAELLLRRWNHGDIVELVDRQIRQQPRRPPGRRWELGPGGHTFAIVTGPLEFWMGSPDNEEDRFDHETLHYRRIDRSLAVATKEVTIEQYRQFKPGFRQETRFSRETNCPANLVDWFEAAEYCNWLSRQGGIDEDQWCYPARVESGMVVPDQAASRLGYRLPTEAEWEYLCRAGSETARPFDSSGEVISRHAWTWMNSEDKCRPVGSLLPNELGLFDMLGNLWEWCHYNPVMSSKGDYPPYPASTRDNPALDVDRSSTIIVEQTWRILRGGAFDYSPAQARSAHRYSASVGYKEGTIGFRVVRTIPTSVQ